MILKKLKIFPILLAVGSVFLLCILGTWQVQRLQWKTALLGTISAQQSAPVLPFNHSSALEEFQKVTVTGHFLPSSAIHLMGKLEKGKLGIHVVRPFQTKEGKVIAIDLGWQPKGFLSLTSFSEVSTLIATVRLPQKPGVFTPDNDPSTNQWYWVDLPSLASHWNLSIDLSHYLAIDYIAPPLRNNHLGYAITWYSLAAVLIVFIWLHRQRFYK